MTDTMARELQVGDRVTRVSSSDAAGTVVRVWETPSLTVPLWVDVEWDTPSLGTRMSSLQAENVEKL